MTVAVIVGISLFVSDASTRRDGLMVVIGGGSLGVVLGTSFLVLSNILGGALRGVPPIRRLTSLGVTAVWKSKRPVPFQSDVVRMLKAGGSLDVICHDALDLMTALSHPAHGPLAAPNPALKQHTVRFLVLPPQSQRRDPEFAQRSTAEVGLLKLGLSPEEHWRRLATLLETRRRWQEEYGVNVEIRFLENRPSFRMICAGNRVWFQPWEETACWLEAVENGLQRKFFSAMRDHFVDAWGTSACELSVNLNQGPTKSTFIKKGVEVDIQPKTRLTLTESEYSLG